MATAAGRKVRGPAGPRGARVHLALCAAGPTTCSGRQTRQTRRAESVSLGPVASAHQHTSQSSHQQPASLIIRPPLYYSVVYRFWKLTKLDSSGVIRHLYTFLYSANQCGYSRVSHKTPKRLVLP